MNAPAPRASAPLSDNAPKMIPIWLIDSARGVISLILGVGLLIWRDQFLTLFFAVLIINLLIDGGFDVVSFFFRNRRRSDIGVSYLIIGLLSVVVAALILFHPVAARVLLVLILYAFAALAALRGLRSLWELATSFWHRRSSLLLLARGVAWLLLSATLFIVPTFALNTAIVLLGVLLIVDALGSFASAIVKQQSPHARVSTPPQLREITITNTGVTLPPGPHALVFVRRSGAFGLGHVGWAFEWGNGYFNTGSVENFSGAAYSSPDKMGFWTANTPRPVTTMHDQREAYDAFKVFSVTQPTPSAAWNAVVWLSRQPYWVVRRNCSDCVYDVLRAYGVSDLLDTAQENVPNLWYDALPGPSYLIDAGAELLGLDLPTQAEQLLHHSIAQHYLTIEPTVEATPPPWRARGGRVWYEVQQRFISIVRRAYTFFIEVFKIPQRNRRKNA